MSVLRSLKYANGQDLLCSGGSLYCVLRLDAVDTLLLVIDLSLNLRLVQSVDDDVLAFGDMYYTRRYMSDGK